MKRTKIVPFLLFSFLLTACGPTSEPTSPSTSEEPTTSSADGNKGFEKLAQDTIGTRIKLSNYLPKFADRELISVNYSTSKETTYEEQTTNTSVMFRSDEVYIKDEVTTTQSSGVKSSTETQYAGIVNSELYTASISSSDSNFSNVRKYKISDTKEVYEIDIIDLTAAQETVTSLKSSYNLSLLTQFNYWSSVLTNSSFKQTSYELNIFDDSARVVLKGYQEGYTCSASTLIATFDTDLNIISGTLTTEKYQSSNWDKTTHTPIDVTKIQNKTKATLDGVEYGEPFKTGSKTMIDLNKYIVSSLNSSLIKFSNFVTNQNTGVAIYSEPNTLYPNQPVDAPIESIKENKAYLPETALNMDSLYITGASVDGFLTLDGYGWTVSGNVGDKANIYIGDSFNPKLAEVEVTIVKSPVKNKANYSPTLVFLTTPEEGNYTYQGNLARPVLTLKSMDTFVMAIATTNKGPFEELDLGFVYDKEFITPKILTNQEEYIENYGANRVYFSITPVKKGTSTLILKYISYNEGIFEVDIVVE